MSKPNVKRFKNQKIGPNGKVELNDYLGNEINQVVSEFDDALTRGLSFADNFAGKIVTLDLTAGTEKVFLNPLGKIPSGWLVLSGSVPMIVEGSVWTKDQLSFNSMCFRLGEFGVDLTTNTGSDFLSFTTDRFPVFTKGMKVKITGNSLPGGLTDGNTYYQNTENTSVLYLSNEKNGKTINLTSSGADVALIAATGSVRILLLK